MLAGFGFCRLSRLAYPLAGLLLLAAGASAGAQEPVDLELVIAVDVSLSMDQHEQRGCSAMATSPPCAIPRSTAPSPRGPTAASP